uniref:RNA polymerase alpha subunit n=1 Tax=Xyris capensis TaxID=114207 RepID=UPI001F12B68F|nr:RNA polymerase alpha subunit [Xyris capensis]ULQ68527.1 RNA polymerase alpha subunit [Xyris capensis]
MVRKEVTGSTRPIQWKCVESRVYSKRLYYGRFILSPLRKGQADTIGIAMRRALLGEIESTCITRAKLEKVPHEYSTIVGVEESVHEILLNLKEIVLKSNLYGIINASICARGPKYVTAQDIISAASLEVVDPTQHIATLTEPIDFFIELQIKKSCGYRIESTNNSQDGTQDGTFHIDAVFMPVRNANYSTHSYGNEKEEILFLEIWTNGSLTPKEALLEASRNLIDLFLLFLHPEQEKKGTNSEETKNKITIAFLTFQKNLTNFNLKKNKNTIPWDCIFIDQLELPSRTYNCLKRSNIHTLSDLLSNSQQDLMKMEYFRKEDLKHILDTLQKHFSMDLPKK